MREWHPISLYSDLQAMILQAITTEKSAINETVELCREKLTNQLGTASVPPQVTPHPFSQPRSGPERRYATVLNPAHLVVVCHYNPSSRMSSW